jgi:putative ABC transport system permease protein
VREELLGVPGVRSVESYRAVRPAFRGDRILVSSMEISPLLDRTHQTFLQGDAESMRRGLTQEGKCAVSDNFFRKFGLGRGDLLEVATPSKLVKLPIVAVFQDYSSDRGTVLIDRSLFLSLWKDDRVDTFDVNLLPGADVGKVRDSIRARLAASAQGLVSTRQELEAEIGRAVGAFYNLVSVTVFLALIVAFLGIVTSLLISVAERKRDFGVLKALGALGSQLQRSVVLEAVVLSVTGLLLAVPAGNLLAYFLETTVAEVFAGWQMPHRYPWGLAARLAVSLPLIAAFASWVPARQAARTNVAEALGYE